MGLPLRRRRSSGEAIRQFARCTCIGYLLLGCRSSEPKKAEGAAQQPEERPRVQSAAASPPPASASASASPRPQPAAPAGAAASASFLVGASGHDISVRSLDGQTRVLIPAVSSSLYDEAHGLLWLLDEDRLAVSDLRQESPPVVLAKGLPPVGSVWVEWPNNGNSQFVRPDTGCEESTDAVEIKLGSKPSLRLVDSEQRKPFSPDGLRWLKAQTGRSATPSRPVKGFESDAQRVSLPEKWSGCDDAERCGLSEAFGAGPLRLVLVKDTQGGGDCFQRSCLLFDPQTKRFASPPILTDAGGTPSVAPRPPRWTSAKEALPGACGTYLFDKAGTRFLIRQFLCQLNGDCQDLGAEAIGWLQSGVVVGGAG